MPTKRKTMHGKKLASQVDEISKELEKEREKAKDYLNKLMYLQAEFENYQKRIKREIEESVQFGNQKLITELLPVIDELEYALEAGKVSNNKEALLQGVQLTFKKFYGILEREGLTKIDAKGKPFDPFQHEVVQRSSMESDKEIVINETRKGYSLKGKVIRPSLVEVTSKKSDTHE